MAQRSDTGFTIGVVVVALVVAGLGIFFLGRGGVDSPVVAVPNQAVHHRVHRVTGGSPTRTATRAGALALVRRDDELGLHGRYAASCALESPAYRRFDAERYRAGSCVAASRAAMRLLAAQGISLRVDNVRLASFGAGKAVAVLSVTGGSRTIEEHVYLQYHRGRWWITGGDDSGDLGY